MEITTIKNTLNTCFLASVVQLLMVEENLFEKSNEEYQSLIEDYKKGGIINIIPFLNYYRKLDNNYVLGSLNDAHESLCYILDDLSNKKIFQFKYKQIITRENEILENEMTENIISVVIKDSLQQSLDSFFISEKEDLLQRTPRIDFLPINNPEYLFLSVKRFNPITGLKDENYIECEETIIYNLKKYKCLGFIIHIGSTEFGHYICLTKKDKWILYDDESYNEDIDDYEALKMQNMAYIYLYKKI